MATLRVGTSGNQPPLNAMAKDGTVVGFDMDLAAQAKVLRALEEQAFERVGGHETLKVDAAITRTSTLSVS